MISISALKGGCQLEMEYDECLFIIYIVYIEVVSACDLLIHICGMM